MVNGQFFGLYNHKMNQNRLSRASHKFTQNLHEDKRTLETGVSVNIL